MRMVLPLMYYNVLHNWICQQNQCHFHGKECDSDCWKTLPKSNPTEFSLLTETIFFNNQWDTLNYDPRIKLWPHKNLSGRRSQFLWCCRLMEAEAGFDKVQGVPKKMLLSDLVVLAFSSAWFAYFTAFLRSTLQLLIELLAHKKRNWELFCSIERLSAKFWILSKTSYSIVFNTFNS